MCLVGDIAAQVVGLLRDQGTDASTAADAGEVTVAQFVGLSEDLRGGVGIDGGRGGVGNHRRDDCVARLHIAGNDDDPVFSLGRLGQP
ncbi:hypothetical protein D3C78_1722270 [compost metagenome]